VTENFKTKMSMKIQEITRKKCKVEKRNFKKGAEHKSKKYVFKCFYKRRLRDSNTLKKGKRKRKFSV